MLGGPPQVPAPSQVSGPVHAFPSLHAVPAAVGSQCHWGTSTLHVGAEHCAHWGIVPVHAQLDLGKQDSANAAPRMLPTTTRTIGGPPSKSYRGKPGRASYPHLWLRRQEATNLATVAIDSAQTCICNRIIDR